MKTRNLVVIVCLCLLLAGCKQAAVVDAKSPDANAVPTLNPGVVFECEYVRTDGHVDENEYTVVTGIASVEALQAYVEANEDTYQFGDEFEEAVMPFDEAYFEENMLVMVVVEETSSANRHEVTSVVAKGNVVNINIKRTVPNPGTDEMAQWHIIVASDNEYFDHAFNVDIY